MMNNSGYSEAPGFGLGDEVDDMPSTEKDLAEDAPWKKIQQNTFTRWCNEHLKCVGKRLTDLQRDLSDGCGRSPKRRGSLRFLPPLEVRPSSVAPDPAVKSQAPPAAASAAAVSRRE